MKKRDYLALALQSQAYRKYEWLLHMLAMVLSEPKNPTVLHHLKQIDGEHFYWDGETYLPIEDSVKGQPLFVPDEPVKLKKGELASLSSDVDTTIMRVLINAVCLDYAVGDLFPFINSEIKVKQLEELINSKLVTAPGPGIKVPGKATSEQLVQVQRGIETLAKLSSVIVYACSPKSILPPPGIVAFKKKLVAEYKAAGKDLQDGMVASEFQDRLKEYDRDYLKDDPMFKNGVDAKTGKARLKVHMAFGKESGFAGGELSPTVTESLKEGVTKTPEAYAAAANTCRAGSFNRGKDTQKGGVTSVLLARLVFDLPIDQNDCGSKEYREVQINEVSPKFHGRYTDKLVKIDNDFLLDHMGKTVKIRSAQYCSNVGFCRICLGDRMGSGHKTPQMFATAISDAILSSSLAKFHGLILETVTTDILEVTS